MARGSRSAPVSLAFGSAQGHSGTRRALRVDEVPVDAGMHVREAIDEAVVDDHAERPGEGVRFAAVVVSATARAAALPTSRPARPTLQRPPFAALGARGGHAKTRRCARPARWSTGHLWRIAELLTRGSISVGGRCDQPCPGPSSVRASGWRRAGAPRLLAGHAMARAALPGTPGALDVPLRGRPDTNAECRSSQGPCASSVTPNPDTPMVAYGWWYARTGIIWSSSGRTRPVPVAPAVGLPALSSVCSPQRAARRRGSPPWRAGTASAPVPGPTLTAVPVIETGHRPAPGDHLVVDIDVDHRACPEAGSFPIRSVNASQRAWRLAFRQAAGHPLTASRVDARLAALMPANPPGRPRQPAGKT